MNALIDIPHTSPVPSPGIVKKLSQRHRSLARMLASGASPGDCARILRYDPSRVSVLQTDPSFKAMVSYYEAVRDEEFRASSEKLADLTETVIDELQTRLEDSPGEFSASQLTELLKTAADRTGLGPTSTQRHLHVAVTQETLDAIKQRISDHNSGNVEVVSIIEAEREPTGSASLFTPEGPDVQDEKIISLAESRARLSSTSNEKDKE